MANASHWSRQKTTPGPNLPPPNRSRAGLSIEPNIITNSCGWIVIAKLSIILGKASYTQWLVRIKLKAPQQIYE
jgi:hypothetical protein